MPSRFHTSRLVAVLTVAGALMCVYFQAAAASSLMAASLLPPLPIESRGGAVQHRAEPERPRFAPASLRANNPFDWRVDLGGKPEPGNGADSVPTPDGVGVNPLLVEVCTQVAVTLVTETTDPRESIGVLQGPEDASPIQRRVGDRVGDYEVAYIGFNRTKATPAVWLLNDTGLCQTLLFGPESAERPARRDLDQKRQNVANETQSKAKPRHESRLAEDLARRIVRVDDTHVAVERGVVDQVLADPSVFIGAARIVPAKDGVGTSAIRLFGVRDGSLLDALNLKNGDVLNKVNGFDLGSPEQALTAYARLRTAQDLSVEVTREGKPVTLQVSIE